MSFDPSTSISRSLRRVLVSAVALLVAETAVWAEGPQVRFLTVTDVTPRSFQVVWLSNQPATATLRLFEAPDCVSEIFTAAITPFPTVSGSWSIVEAAQRKGILLVKAAGLKPDTEYCVQTVTTSSVTNLVTMSPVPAMRVRTEKKTTRARSDGSGGFVPFGNDLARVEISRQDPGASTEGALVLVKLLGASSPLAGFVGDGITDAAIPGAPTGLALIDLNNLYRAATRESMDLVGNASEEISTWTLGGPQGFVAVQARVVPTTAGLVEILSPGICREVAMTECDGRLGDANGDGEITVADAVAVREFVVVGEPALACQGCGDVTWDFAEDMKDALAVAQAAAVLRTLPW